MFGLLALSCAGLSADDDSEKGSVGPGAIQVNVKAIIGVLNCFGDGTIKCSQKQTLNAIGTPFNVNVRTAQFTDLGTISSSTNKSLAIPSSTAGKTLYKFTNDTGETIYLGIEMKPTPRRGSLYATLRAPSGEMLVAGTDYNVLEIYRYAQGEWKRNNVIFVTKGTQAIEVAITPQGATNVAQTVTAPQEAA
jgi:hypothetical protein